ncbi:MAG: type II toxin-antitoxin system VapC family toxin [Tepidiforma sp.]
MPFVLDASVTLSWLFRDETDGYADAALGALEHDAAVVPALWSYEVVNALAAAVRRGRLSRGELRYVVELLGSLPIAVSEAPGSPAARLELADLALDQQLSAYDAAYVALARAERLPLATLDERLRRAAAAAGVAAWVPPP